jgi:integrase
MGSIRRAPRTRRWEARWRDPTRRSRTRTFDSKADARAFLSATETDMSRGRWVDPALGRITYTEWCVEYFAAAVHKRATTLSRDRTVNDKHFVPTLGMRQLSSITSLDVRRLVEEMNGKLAPATVRTNYGVLRAILSGAVEADVLAVSPCRGVRLPAAQPRRAMRFLSAEELSRLADETPADYRPMIYLGGVLGLRWSEVAGLRVGRLDFLRRTLEIAETCAEVEGRVFVADVKTRASRRTLRMPAFLMDSLAQHLSARGRPGADELVFVAPEGGPLRRSTFRTRVFAPAVRRAGLERLTFHQLRHSAVGLMVEAGAHVEAIKQRLGHSSIRVTSDVYGHVLPAVEDALSDALEARFGGLRGAAVVQNRPEFRTTDGTG